ncbi:MAG: hypothetical protein NVS1B2_23140 [Vulcanimicrobiaceae bacterium]
MPASARAIALGIAVAVLDFVLPGERFAYAQLVPLLVFARGYGLRPALAVGLILAIVLGILERDRALVATWQGTLADTLALALTYSVVLVVVEAYIASLRRTHRREFELAADENASRLHVLSTTLPLEVRREEAAALERDLAAIAESIPQLVWRSRGDGAVEYYNEAWLAYTGLAREDPGATITNVWQVVADDDFDDVRTRWEAALGAGTAFEVELRLRRHDGSYRWHLARATPLRDHAGHIVRWFGTCTDIHEQKREQATLTERFNDAHRVSEAFQRASLPTRLPDVPGVRFSALYRAGKREAAVGGDWYDALRLLDGRVVISIGDVAGSGLGAAITMVAMRQAMRGAAQIHADPISILEAADRTLREDTPDRMVTAFVGVYDPVTRGLTYALAGHPTPFVRVPGGEIVALTAPGLPLGVRRKGDTEARVTRLESGAFLALYTDGLVESTHDFIAGERRLREAVARVAVPSTISAAERLAALVLPNGATDDVAILALRFEDERDDDRVRRVVFRSAERRAARETLAAVAAMLVAAGATEAQLGDAEMIFSELVGNVVRHAPGQCEVVLDASAIYPVLSVLDRGRGFTFAPHLPQDAFAENGRGLYIVRSLAAEFGATRRPEGGSHTRAVLTVNQRPKRRAARPAALPFVSQEPSTPATI